MLNASNENPARRIASKISYFKFSNDFENKTGIVVFAVQVITQENEKDIVEIGYSLIPPNAEWLKKEVASKAEKEAYNNLKSDSLMICIGYASTGELRDTVLMTWMASKNGLNLPEWASNLNLATNAHDVSEL